MAKKEVKYGVLSFQCKSLILVCFISFFFIPQCQASGEPFPIGARSWGIGNATVAIADKQSIFNNPAGLGFLTDNFISTSYHNRYTVAGLNTFSLGGNYNTKWVNVGLAVERFGDKLYHEEKLGLALAKSTNRVSLGVKVSYLQAAVENFSVKNTLLTEFGVMAKLSSTMFIGFNAYNLTAARLYLSQRVPTLLRLGLSYQPTKQLLLIGEAEKDILLPTLFKVGLEYQIVKNFYLRTGITSKLSNVHFGIGFQAKQFIFDYAASSHSILGFSHHLTLAYQLGKTQPKSS
ncbi:PorV/PorQ family protein [Emticicia fontis]